MEKIDQKKVNTFILNSCFSKRVYLTEHEAWCASVKIAEEKKSKVLLRPYGCKVCNKFHLTSIVSSQRYFNPKKDLSEMKLRNTKKYRKGRK